MQAEIEKSVVLTKQRIRSKILLKLKTQKEEERIYKSSIVKDKLFKTREFKKAKIVMFYVSCVGEVETKDMIKQAQKFGKIIVAPTCAKNRMLKPCFFEKGARLIRGPYGIREPVTRSCINPKKIDLVVAPGLAFDRRGHRLGRGKGYYDRFLKKMPAKTPCIGLAFDFQILPAIPTTDQDVNVNKVIFA